MAVSIRRKVEIMNTNFPCSEETLASLSPNNFNKLEDAITEK